MDRRHFLALTGAAALPRHAWALGPAAVTPVLTADRKALARHCEGVVADGYARLMRA